MRDLIRVMRNSIVCLHIKQKYYFCFQKKLLRVVLSVLLRTDCENSLDVELIVNYK